MLCISFGTSPLYSCSEQKEKQKVMLVWYFACNTIPRLSIGPSLTRSHSFFFSQLRVWVSFFTCPWNNQCKRTLRYRKLEGPLSSCHMATPTCLSSTPFVASSLLDSRLVGFFARLTACMRHDLSAVKIYSWMEQQKQFMDSWCSLTQSARELRDQIYSQKVRTAHFKRLIFSTILSRYIFTRWLEPFYWGCYRRLHSSH